MLFLELIFCIEIIAHDKLFRHYKPKYIALAREIISVKPNVKFYAVPCPVHGNICKEQTIKGYPTVKFFKAGSSEGEVLAHNVKGETILKDHLGLSKEEIKSVKKSGKANGISKSIGNNELAFSSTVGSNIKDVSNDATLSFDFAVRNSIFLTIEKLSNTQAHAFQKWLDLVNKSIPVSMKGVKDDVMLLLHHFDGVIQSEEKMLKFVSKKNVSSWSQNCSKGVNGAGYTCGLWELFHIVTVGIVQWNIASEHARVSTLDAADTIRDYIENYFTCDECRKNFIAMYEACQFQRCDRLSKNVSEDAIKTWKQLPLWLWETHNDVNVRLMNESRMENGLPKANFDEEQKARWPSSKSCPQCWRGGGEWDEEEVYKYLRSYYWPNDLLDNSDLEVKKIPQARMHSKDGKMNIFEPSYGNKASNERTKVSSGIFKVKTLAFLGLFCVMFLTYYIRRRRKRNKVRLQKSK